MAALAVAAVLVGMAVAAGIVVLVASAIFGRDEVDPTGRRAKAIYLGVVAFIAVYLAVFSSFGVVVSLGTLIGPRGSAVTQLALPNSSPLYASSSSASGSSTSSPAPIVGPQTFGRFTVSSAPSTNDQVASVSLSLFLVTLAALGVLAFHRRRLAAALAEAEPGPVLRVMTIYRLGVSLVGVFITALAFVGAAYGVFRIIAPGVSGASGRGNGLQELIDAGYLGLAGAAVVYLHRRPTTSDAQESPDGSAAPAENA